MRYNISCISISSSIAAAIAFKDLITHLHYGLSFSKSKDSINVSVTFGSYTISFIAEVILCEKSMIASFGAFIILLNDSYCFPDSSTLFQAFKSTKQHRTKVWSSNFSCLCNSVY